MRSAIAALFLTAAFSSAHARPSDKVIETCVKAETISTRTSYNSIAKNKISDIVDEETGEKETIVSFEKDRIGTWENSRPKKFGLVYNDKKIEINRVERLSSEAPAKFDPSLALWGKIKEGSQVYICITFNFEGLGQNGSFQAVRGIYLIDQSARSHRVFYTIGKIQSGGITLAK